MGLGVPGLLPHSLVSLSNGPVTSLQSVGFALCLSKKDKRICSQCHCRRGTPSSTPEYGCGADGSLSSSWIPMPGQLKMCHETRVV